MNALDVFDFVRIINLPERVDRLKATVRELERIGILLDGEKVKVFSAIRPPAAEGFPSIGARGCFLSHLEVLRAAHEAGARKLLVIEDDIQFEKSFCSRIASALKAAQAADWDLLWLGHVVSTDGCQDIAMVPCQQGLLTTHMYAVNGGILPRLITEFEAMLERPPGHPDGGPMFEDGAFTTFCLKNPEIVRMIAMPSWARQRSSRSDISPRGWVNTWPVLRTIADKCRTIRNHVLDQITRR